MPDMDTEQTEGQFSEEDYKNLVFFGGYLVPLAHVKAIETWLSKAMIAEEEGEEEKTEYGFRVYLSAPLEDESDNLSVELFQSWPSQDEANEAMASLARRLDDWYDKLTG